ncbi:MAG: CotH kinase family protein [Bacteroidales bacterium]|nr:CotH kinase family protein [Bacteroidales bacterium]
MKLILRLLCLFLIFLVGNAYTQEFTHSNLPIIVIETNGQTIPNEPKIEVDMGIIYNGPSQINYLTDPFNEYDGIVGIELRGSTSLYFFPKKPYAFETRDSLGNNLNVSLLGMPAENDWILYAPYSDKSLIRNVLAYKLSNDLGQYASRSHYCELVINGNYKGIYVLLEKIKRDDNRVAIAEMDENDIAGDSLTGGYIIKIDKVSGNYTGGWISQFPPYPGAWQEIFYQYHYPKEQNIEDEQKEYIQDFIFEFESLMDSENFNDPVIGYPSIIDLNSFIDFILINELSKNVDAYRLSTYLHKDRNSINSRLKAGPVWDFNITFGNVDYAEGFNPEGWVITSQLSFGGDYTMPFWWEKMMDDPAFFQSLVLRWNILRQSTVHPDSILNYIDNLAAYLDEAQQRNFERWPVLGEYIWPNYFIGETYEEEVDYFKNWIADRITWMDDALKLQPIITEINYHSSPGLDAGDWIEIYNPASENKNISGWQIKNEDVVFFTFPPSTFIQPESYIIVCEDLMKFQMIFPDIINCLGNMSAGLNDQGETLELHPPAQSSIDMLTFTNNHPWPLYADGTGNTIELNHYLTDNSMGINWHTSFTIGGSPGYESPIPVLPLLYINELLADNESVIADEFGDYDDWIELYNKSEIPIDVGGMYISDNNNSLYRIPQTNSALTTIPWGGFLLLWADDEIEEGELHLNFKLSKQEDRIDLYMPNGFTKVDSIIFYEQEEDISFGRITDGTDQWITFSTPTPNASNSGSVEIIDIVQPKILIYPNPAKDKFMVDMSHNKFKTVDLKLYDIFGGIVLEKHIYNTNNIISVSNLSAGFYVVILEADGMREIKKITILKN